MGEHLLDDLRVVEWGASRATAYCGRLLADLGADVIKVEPAEGDWMRSAGPLGEPDRDLDAGGLFACFHRGKRSVVIDPQSSSWRTTLHQLLKPADVLLADRNLQASPLPLLDRGSIALAHPRLVHVVLSPFGETGPYADYRGNALTAWAMSGIMYSTGDPDREPLANGTNPADFFGGQHAFLGVLAALEARQSSGEGDSVDVSLAEAMAAADDYSASVYAATGAIRRRFYSRHLWSFPSGEIQKCKNGYITVIGGGQVANSFALLVDNPELEGHPLLTSSRFRMVDQDGFLKLFSPWLREHEADEILDKAQLLGLPFAPVLDVSDLASNEQLEARGFFSHVDVNGKPVLVPGPPVSFKHARLADNTRVAQQGVDDGLLLDQDIVP